LTRAHRATAARTKAKPANSEESKFACVAAAPTKVLIATADVLVVGTTRAGEVVGVTGGAAGAVVTGAGVLADGALASGALLHPAQDELETTGREAGGDELEDKGTTEVVHTDQLEVSEAGSEVVGAGVVGTGTLEVVQTDQLELSGTSGAGDGKVLEDHGCQLFDELFTITWVVVVSLTGVVVVCITGVVVVVVTTIGLVVVDQTDQ